MLSLGYIYKQCTLTQYVVNGLSSPDKLLKDLITFISKKRYSYPIATLYIAIYTKL